MRSHRLSRKDLLFVLIALSMAGQVGAGSLLVALDPRDSFEDRASILLMLGSAFAVNFAFLGGLLVAYPAVASPRLNPLSPTSLTPGACDRLLADLAADDELRLATILRLAGTPGSPLSAVTGWPIRLSALQRATAEVILREWLLILRESPDLSEEELIDRLFPPTETPIPRPIPDVEVALDALNSAVRETILDLRLPDRDDSYRDPTADRPLGPIDRDRFVADLTTHFADVAQAAADAVAEARTDYELTLCEPDLARCFGELRWDALALALDLRTPPSEPRPLPPARMPRRMPLEPPAPNATADWAKKYRRMRAAGL